MENEFCVGCALVTPYGENGKVDLTAAARIARRMAAGGVDLIVCAGTTGEGQLVEQSEAAALVGVCKIVAPRAKVWMGIAESNVSRAAMRARSAERCGVDGILLAPPSFCKCTERGFESFAGRVADEIGAEKVCLYNCPDRCGYEISESVIENLASLGVGMIKDAGKNERLTEFAAKRMKVLCGNDGEIGRQKAIGAQGVISVAANASPCLVSKICREKATEQKRTAFDQMCRVLFAEVNPVPVKYLLWKMGLVSNCELRTPLSAANEQTRRIVDEFWEKYGELMT